MSTHTSCYLADEWQKIAHARNAQYAEAREALESAIQQLHEARSDLLAAERGEQEANDRAEKAEQERDKLADLFGAALDSEDRSREETRAVRDAQRRTPDAATIWAQGWARGFLERTAIRHHLGPNPYEGEGA